VTDRMTAAVEFIGRHDRLLVTSHVLPDCDAVGSCVALRAALTKLGRRAEVVLPSQVPARYGFLTDPCPVHCWPDVDEVLARDWDGLIVLDSSDWSRVGPLGERFEGRFTDILAIDHHPGHDAFATVVVVDDTAPATVCLIHELIGALGVEFDVLMANALMTGLRGDTGSFSYANTTREAFLMAAHLVECGCQVEAINRHLNERFTLAGVAFMQEALANLRTEADGTVGWLPLPYETFERHGATIQDGIPLLRFVRGIRGVRLAVVLYEDERNRVKISFRSRGDIDVGEFARSFGGGGHRAASGLVFEGSLAEAEARILPRAVALVTATEDVA